jgi:hypothetical protein
MNETAYVMPTLSSLDRHSNPEKSQAFYDAYLLAGVTMSDNTATQIKKLEIAILDGQECLRQVEENRLKNTNPHISFIFDHAKKNIDYNISYWQDIMIRISSV